MYFYSTYLRFPVLLVAFFVSTSLLAGERVSFLIHQNGDIEFQIHESQAGHYIVEIEEVRSGKLVMSVDNFKKGENIPVLISKAKSDLKAGLYRCRLKRDGVTALEAPPLAQSGDDVFETALGAFERRDAKVNWTATFPCLARVQIMSSSGAILHLLKGWHFSNAGNQSIPWDYLDSNKRWNFSPYPGLQALVQYWSLPANWLVIGQPNWEDYRKDPQFSDLARSVTSLPLDFELKVEAMVKDPGLAKNEPVNLREGAVLKIALGEAARKSLDGQRFEILLYLDGEFFHEESQGVDPYTYVFPSFPDSMTASFLTVNVIDYLGNHATRTLPVRLATKP